MLFEFRQGEGFCKKISVGTWSLLGPGEEEKWHGTHYYKPEGQWNTTAGVMVADFKDSGHPVFRASSALDRRFLKKKMDDARFTSVLNLRTQSFYFAQFILQVSSAFTEQSRIGVMN